MGVSLELLEFSFRNGPARFRDSNGMVRVLNARRKDRGKPEATRLLPSANDEGHLLMIDAR